MVASALLVTSGFLRRVGEIIGVHLTHRNYWARPTLGKSSNRRAILLWECPSQKCGECRHEQKNRCRTLQMQYLQSFRAIERTEFPDLRDGLSARQRGHRLLLC